MKKGLTILILGIVFALILQIGVVFAEQATAPAARKIEKREEQKNNLIRRIENIIGNRVEHFNQVIVRSDKLLEKIQIRIDRAKAAGKDVTELENLMQDARKKLADAEMKTGEINGLKPTINNRAGFQQIHTKFKSIRDDLHNVRINVSKMIRILKGFNSATSSGQNPQKEGTSPAVRTR